MRRTSISNAERCGVRYECVPLRNLRQEVEPGIEVEKEALRVPLLAASIERTTR